MTWYTNFENWVYAGPELYSLCWVLKEIICHFISDRRFCERLPKDLIRCSNGLRLRVRNFDVPLSYVLMVSTSRCFDFGGELTLGGLHQKHAARCNKFPQGCF